MTLAMRSAGGADLDRLHALVERAYRGESARAGWTHEADLVKGPRTSRAELAAIVAGPDDRVLLFEEADALVACVHVSRRAGERVYLGMLAIEPARQAAGLGKAVLMAAEDFARGTWQAHVAEMSVISRRIELIAYYQRRGYQLTGAVRPFPIRLDPPLELLVMEKALTSSRSP